MKLTLEAKRERKAIRKEIAEIEVKRRETIAKAIRRNRAKLLPSNKTAGEVAYGKGMQFLRAIHREVSPVLEKMRHAESQMFSSNRE